MKNSVLTVHGGWSDWETDGVCDQACGGGLMVKLRYCDSPMPEHSGTYCDGSPTQTESCNLHKCSGIDI